MEHETAARGRPGRPRANAPTDRQGDVLAAIARHQARTGESPTMREIAAAIGVEAASGVSRMLDELERMGRIRRRAGVKRSIEILDPHGPKRAPRDLARRLQAEIKVLQRCIDRAAQRIDRSAPAQLDLQGARACIAAMLAML